MAKEVENVNKTEDVQKERKFPPVRSMTRRELKALRSKGLDLALVENTTIKLGVEMGDFILETCFPEFDFDDLPADECMQFATRIYRRTYGRDVDEKN